MSRWMVTNLSDSSSRPPDRRPWRCDFRPGHKGPSRFGSRTVWSMRQDGPSRSCSTRRISSERRTSLRMSSLGHAHSPSERDARDFIDRSDFPWHQEFALVPGVLTPGRSPVDALLGKMVLPNLEEAAILDIGTFNGGLAFTLERL